jgi:hypothetical protein
MKKEALLCEKNYPKSAKIGKNGKKYGTYNRSDFKELL